MAGETDLKYILATLTVSRRPGVFTMVSIPNPVPLGDGVEMVLSETEGTTVVATLDAARRRGWAHDFQGAWLTIDVHSSLEAVGLTRAMAAVLGDANIACNVLAGFYHDHILVPVDRVDEAIAQLTSLASSV